MQIPESKIVLQRGESSTFPIKASLKQFMPEVGNQGPFGTCVAWASAYYAATILENIGKGQTENNTKYSPTFIYNNLKDDTDSSCSNGLYINDALDFMKYKGMLPDSFYDASCRENKDNDSLLWDAAFLHRIKDFRRIGKEQMNLRIKKALLLNRPVVIGIKVVESFMISDGHLNGDTWDGTMKGYENESFELLDGHALCLIGYDDNKEGGSFEIVNSWGKEWGDEGEIWIKYSDLNKLLNQAFEVIGFSKTEKEKNAIKNNFSGAIKIFDDSGKELELEEDPWLDFLSAVNIHSLIKYSANNSTINGSLKYKLRISSPDSVYVYLFKYDYNEIVHIVQKNGDDVFLSKPRPDVIIPDTSYFEINNASDNFPEVRTYIILLSKNKIPDEKLEDALFKSYSGPQQFIINNFANDLVLRKPEVDFWSTKFALKNDPGTILPILIDVSNKKIKPKPVKKAIPIKRPVKNKQ